MRPLIIGIDPGTTSAYAVLDFDFNLIAISSKKEFSLSEMISSIIYLGDPVIIGTDKKEIPSFIKSVSNKIGAKILAPRYDMKKGEKKRIVQDNKLYKFTRNAHETDALASAIFAYNEYRQLIKKINNSLKKQNKLNLKEKIIQIVILEEISISKALNLIEKQGDEIIKKIKKKRMRQSTPQKKLSKEQKQILLLKSQNLKLSQELNKQNNELRKQENKKIDLDKETRKLLSFKEQKILFFEKLIENQNRKIKEFEDKIQNLNNLITSANDYVLIKKLDDLSREEFNKKSKLLKIKEKDILLVEDISIVSSKIIAELINRKINILMYNKNPGRLLNNNFILINKNNFKLNEIGDFAFVNKNEFDSILKKESNKKRYDEDLLKNIVEEYRKERYSE